MPNINGLKRIPKAELYRLIVDGQFHATQNGWLDYAMREPNCLPAVFRAFQVAFTSLNELDVSVELIKNIHAAAAKDVSGIVSDANKYPGLFRTMQTGYFLNRVYVNSEGLGELLDLINHELGQYGACLCWKSVDFLDGCKTKEESNHRIHVLEQTKESKEELWGQIAGGKRLFYRPPRPEVLDLLVSKECAKYNQNIKEATSEDAKLAVIVQFVQKVERIHPFPDVNGRVTTVLLQRLLIQNGFLPTMLYNPNYCDGYGQKTFSEEIEKGMRLTKQSMTKPGMAIHAYVTETMKLSYHLPPEVNSTIHDFYLAETELDQFIKNIPSSPDLEDKPISPSSPEQEPAPKSRLSEILARLRIKAAEEKQTKAVAEANASCTPFA